MSPRGARTPKHKDVLTTGQVARICRVAPRTVSKWFDSGQLRGYRIPGSKDRRIPVAQLVSFMKAHGIPLNGLDTGSIAILVLDRDSATREALKSALMSRGGYDVTFAESAFEAGVAIEHVKPSVMIVDVSLSDVQPGQICRDLRGCDELKSLKLVAMGPNLDNGAGQGLLQNGFNAFVSKPFDANRLADIVEELVDVSV